MRSFTMHAINLIISTTALILVLLQHDYDSGPLINGYHGLALVCVLLMVSSIVSCLGLNTQDT